MNDRAPVHSIYLESTHPYFVQIYSTMTRFMIMLSNLSLCYYDLDNQSVFVSILCVIIRFTSRTTLVTSYITR